MGKIGTWQQTEKVDEIFKSTRQPGKTFLTLNSDWLQKSRKKSRDDIYDVYYMKTRGKMSLLVNETRARKFKVSFNSLFAIIHNC